MILLYTSNNDWCYVETKNLDGETNLKKKSVPKIPYEDIEFVDYISKN